MLVWSDGSVLLQLRDDHPPTNANRWGIPGGLVNSGEAPQDAARRELHEETGLSIDGELAPLLVGYHRPTEGSPLTCTAPPQTPTQMTSCRRKALHGFHTRRQAPRA
ncbi:NUDIX domain-containing protein [Micromonospora thermarum]|uniref:NUDIX hydrolase n=1 Tax=Micromonospora thermarum TaxID=2720024 RepID=A0ABX0ZF84_9ACTN|nr:NUDIX hydrolase [Micromonospora thermarum]NJP35209.1 NUDIX hydrolase [Micromonospora thermarum]